MSQTATREELSQIKFTLVTSLIHGKEVVPISKVNSGEKSFFAQESPSRQHYDSSLRDNEYMLFTGNTGKHHTVRLQ